MHCSASRVAQRRGVLTNTFPPYQAKQEVLDAEADQEASLKPFGCHGYIWKDVGQVLEDSNIIVALFFSPEGSEVESWQELVIHFRFTMLMLIKRPV